MSTFAEYFDFSSKFKRKSGDGLDEGRFPFFVSSQENIKRTNEPDYTGEALVFGTGGNASVHYVNGSFSTSGDCLVAKPKRPDIAKSVYYYLKGNIHLLEEGFKGAGLKHISKKYISSLSLPNFLELDTNKIVCSLDKADAIRRKRADSIKLLDDLLRATFLDMFGDPITNPKNFEQTRLELLCDRIVDCLHTTPNHKTTITSYPSLRTSDLQNGYIDLSTTKYVDKPEYEIRIGRLRPEPQDIVYSREGERYGIAALIPEGMTPCLGQRTMLFRVKRNIVTPEFFWALMNSDSVYSQAKAVAGGATAPHINIGEIRKFIVTLPPIPLQNQFSSFVQKIIKKRQSYALFHTGTHDLFHSLVARAFNGEL